MEVRLLDEIIEAKQLLPAAVCWRRHAKRRPRRGAERGRKPEPAYVHLDRLRPV
jgi:hypothetical protein